MIINNFESDLRVDNSDFRPILLKVWNLIICSLALSLSNSPIFTSHMNIQ